MKFDPSDSTKEVGSMVDFFKDFDVVDYDGNYAALRKPGIGYVEVRVLRGSLGAFDYKFVVEKPGERGKLFSGRDAERRVCKYLGLNDCKTRGRK